MITDSQVQSCQVYKHIHELVGRQTTTNRKQHSSKKAEYSPSGEKCSFALSLLQLKMESVLLRSSPDFQFLDFDCLLCPVEAETSSPDKKTEAYRFVTESVRDYLVAKTFLEDSDTTPTSRPTSWINIHNRAAKCGICSFITQMTGRHKESCEDLLLNMVFKLEATMILLPKLRQMRCRCSTTTLPY